MKVSPSGQKRPFDKDMEISLKENRRLVFAFYTLANCLGFTPYKQNKETRELSFKWISWETLLCLIRLVALNSPLSILPFVLVVFFGSEEWSEEEFNTFWEDKVGAKGTFENSKKS